MDQQLDVFVTVAEKKNFSRAAEKLHMTQPAVSQYIKQLEREMNAKLLERTNKMVRLTKAGEAVYHHAREILSLYKRMQTLVDDMMQTASGPLAIGASYTFGEYILPHLIARLRGKYPLIRPTIFIGNTRLVAEKVGGRQLDIGIVEGDVHHSRIYTEPLANDYMVIVVHTGHRLAGRESVSFSDMADETWIVREEGSGTREMTERMFKDHDFRPGSVMEFGSTQVIKESVEAGLGISFLSKWAIRKELALGTLKTLPIECFPFVRQFSLITQDTPFQTKASEVFWDLLHEKITDG
ncbi:MAG TPA: LysR family transcriptional regulator [Bacillales bacterium]